MQKVSFDVSQSTFDMEIKDCIINEEQSPFRKLEE